jgi:hypothetical protein
MNRQDQRGLLASLIAGSTLRGGTPVNYDTAQGIVASLERRLVDTGCYIVVITSDDDRTPVHDLMEEAEALGGDEV